MNNPNPQEALNLLDQAVSQIQLNRESHVRLQQAVQVLKEALKEEDGE